MVPRNIDIITMYVQKRGDVLISGIYGGIAYHTAAVPR